MIALVALAATAALAATPPPARVQVVATEFQYELSRASVKSGRVIIQLVNYGEDPHDLYVKRIAENAKTFKTADVLPEKYTDLNLRLGPGRYQLWCSIADHRARGMRATLTVKK